MIRPDQKPRDPSTPSGPAWAVTLVMVSLIVGIGGMTTWLALKFDALRPGVGDMIVFAPSRSDGDTWKLEVTTTDIAGRDRQAGTCVLDPNEMSAASGSLVIEAREDVSPPRFQLHWAGQRTAKGAGDCGASADVVLDRFDLQRLANAAGGFGVRPSKLE